MSNHVDNCIKGLGPETAKRAMTVLADFDTCGQHAGYDFSYDEENDRLHFSSRNRPPIQAVEGLSKGKTLEMVFSSESDAYQIDKGLLFEDGRLTGCRQRWNVDDKPDPWPEWDRHVPDFHGDGVRLGSTGREVPDAPVETPDGPGVGDYGGE